MVEVEVDTLTGNLKLEKYTAIMKLGRSSMNGL
ncbi:hypothetical protein KEH51_12425 [[Brevibacterium] frigoritolerans]|uniref:Uncharacterized protein n=1 Tax=Peribacillus frigoritolerans TaxID=450367 RepID=A0A941J6S0_9BACI|nr:hypothetical protein [Peribacillus frigoritolerans]